MWSCSSEMKEPNAAPQLQVVDLCSRSKVSNSNTLWAKIHMVCSQCTVIGWLLVFADQSKKIMNHQPNTANAYICH